MKLDSLVSIKIIRQLRSIERRRQRQFNCFGGAVFTRTAFDEDWHSWRMCRVRRGGVAA